MQDFESPSIILQSVTMDNRRNSLPNLHATQLTLHDQTPDKVSPEERPTLRALVREEMLSLFKEP
jgi:hypothetical protein